MKLNRDKGAALVELAIVLPLLILIVFGVCEFGWVMYVNNALGNAGREGARFAAVTYAVKANDPRVAAHVRDCLYVGGYAADDVSVTNSQGVSGRPVSVTVTLNFHSFTKIFPFLEGKKFASEVTMLYER